jgi:hypothetical protein
MNSMAEPPGTTFHWDVRRRFPTVLPGFILLSLLAHAATFFIFRVTYPPQASMSAPPPAVTVLDPKRPDHQALLRWIESEDPSPGINGANTITDRLLQVEYKPSYAKLRTPPLTLPEEVVRTQFPPARDPLTIIRSVEPKPLALAPPPAGNPTRVAFAESLQGRAAGPFPRFDVVAKSSGLLEEAAFLIGVDALGVVQYVMLQSSSGNPASDEEAATYLSTLKLAPADQAISWGRATIQWGGDAFASSDTTRAP